MMKRIARLYIGDWVTVWLFEIIAEKGHPFQKAKLLRD
jgi:hypothetical protein